MCGFGLKTGEIKEVLLSNSVCSVSVEEIAPLLVECLAHSLGVVVSSDE